MKTLLTLFVLFFSASVYADDISDFQIEGISIGDSALDFFSEKHIKRNEQDYYKDKKFTLVENVKLSFEYTNYDIVNFNYKTDDKNYIIHNISGKIDYDNNIDECLIKMDQIILADDVMIMNWNLFRLGKHFFELFQREPTVFIYTPDDSRISDRQKLFWTRPGGGGPGGG